MEIDKGLDEPQSRIISILRKVSSGEISEDTGATLLRLAEYFKGRRLKERSELELRETQLCKQIMAMERFEDRRLWCYLYPTQLNAREKIDSLKVFVERVEVFLRFPLEKYGSLTDNE